MSVCFDESSEEVDNPEEIHTSLTGFSVSHFVIVFTFTCSIPVSLVEII